MNGCGRRGGIVAFKAQLRLVAAGRDAGPWGQRFLFGPGSDGPSEPLADRVDVPGCVYLRPVAFGEGFERGSTQKLLPKLAEELW